jgi:hypothetical protein
MSNKHSVLVAALRSKSIDCYKEGESVTVLVLPDQNLVFCVCWSLGKWHVGSCTHRVTYLLPAEGDIAEMCEQWAALWLEQRPVTTVGEAEAPAEVVQQFGLVRLSKAEVNKWRKEVFDAAMQKVTRRERGEGGPRGTRGRGTN